MRRFLVPRWRRVLVFVGVFLAGGVTGEFVSLRARNAAPAGPSAQQWAEWRLARLESALDLSNEQRERIRPLLRDAGEDLSAVRNRTADEARQILARMLDEIGGELAPEQQEALIKLVHGGQLAEARWD
jgi:uncharacterized membrane protein